MLVVLKKYQYVIMAGVIASLLGYMVVSSSRTTARYERMISTLTTQVAEMKTAQLEANTKQQEYIDKVYTDITTLNQTVNEKLKERNDEVDKWVNAVVLGVNDGMRQEVRGAIDSSRAKALEDSRTAANDIGRVLAGKFSDEVSRSLVEIIADAERTRIALEQCITWSNETKRIIEQQNINTGSSTTKKK